MKFLLIYKFKIKKSASTTLRTKTNFGSTTGMESKKSTAGYESSSESSETHKSKSSLDFLNTLTTGNNTARSNEAKEKQLQKEEVKSITSISSNISPVQTPRVPKPPSPIIKPSNSRPTLAEIIKEGQRNRNQSAPKLIGSLTSTTTSMENQISKTASSTQSVTFREPETEVIVEKNEKIQDILKENKNLRLKNEMLQKQSLELKSKFKQEIDLLIIKVNDNLSAGMTESEKQALIKLLVSRQQEINEKTINDQVTIIRLLEAKSKRLENELEKIYVETDGKC